MMYSFTCRAWFPACLGSHRFHRSRLRADGVSFAATLAACEKCHWVVMPWEKETKGVFRKGNFVQPSSDAPCEKIKGE